MVTKLLLSALVTGMGGALLWLFYHIHTKGKFYVQEPNAVILWAETILLIVCTAYGIYCTIRFLRRK